MDYTSYRLGATETVNISTINAVSAVHGAAQKFANLGKISRVRIQADAACFILVGVNPVATVANGVPVAAGSYEYIDIPAGQSIAAITATGTGKLYITDVSK